MFNGYISFEILALFDAEFSILFIFKQPTQQTANPQQNQYVKWKNMLYYAPSRNMVSNMVPIPSSA